MSFILDALKKSETDRQQQGTAEFATVPVSKRDDGPPRWLWVLGVLLIVNVVVVAGLLLRPSAQPAVEAPAPLPAATIASPLPTETEPQRQFADEIAAAKQTVLPREATVARPESTPAPQTSAAPSTAAVTSSAVNSLALPTAQEVIANGSLTLPTLHVDVHVYAESPADRFVFINMVKHKEGSVLAEGPRVQRITPEGVVLTQNGITFMLPRD